MAVPAQPKIYHICLADRSPSIIASAGLLSDAVRLNQVLPGTVNRLTGSLRPYARANLDMDKI